MSIFAFNDYNQKPGKQSLGEALGEHLGGLCSSLFMHTAEAFGSMDNIRANWIWDDVNGAWNLVVAKDDTDIYTVYGKSDSFVCHFFFKNSVEADNMGFYAWLHVFDAESLERANETITFAVKTLRCY